MILTSFGATNSAQFVDNIVINETKITKGYAFDDATLPSIIFNKAYGFGYSKAFTEQIYSDNWEGSFNAKDTITSSGIEITKYYPILFSISVTRDDNLINLTNIQHQISLKIDNVDIPLELVNNYYLNNTVDCPLGKTIHIIAKYTGYFSSGSVEEDVTITEELINSVIPTIKIKITETSLSTS